MKKLDFNKGWNFTLNGGEIKLVDLPYDFSISQNRTPLSPGKGSNGWYPGGKGVYENSFQLTEEQLGHTWLLQIEGCYGYTEVFVNKQLVKQHPHGYTEFLVDFNPYLKLGKNTVTIVVSNEAMPNTRWYSGSGLYRRVWLLEGIEGYIPPWGVYIKTINDIAHFEVELIGATEYSVAIYSGSDFIVSGIFKKGHHAELKIPNAKKWSPDSPNLYRAEIFAIKDGMETDFVSYCFGLRDIKLDPKFGMLLNGKSIKLHGACVHHDNGVLGANAYTEAEWRKVKLLKEHGFNAVRCSHNPVSRDFLDACDSLGLLVVEEAFDMWRVGKNSCDYHTYFEKFWKEDVYSMVMRDRSRTSIVMWSDGNEIVERDGSSNGVEYAWNIAGYFRSLDDRPLTNALCGIPIEGTDSKEFKELLEKAMTGELTSFEQIPAHLIPAFQGLRNGGNFHEVTKEFSAPLDVVGYNYLDMIYPEMVQKFPDRIAMTTEAFCEDMYTDRLMEEKYPQVIGHFVWTGIDYLGESGIGRVAYTENGGNGGDNNGFDSAAYPYFLASCGEIGITGETLAAGACRKILYGDPKPSIWILSPRQSRLKVYRSKWGWISASRRCWTYPNEEGKRVKVEVYSNAEAVELFVNGKSVGKQQPQKLVARFETEYHSGIIEAVNYRDGKQAERDMLCSVAEKERLLVEKETHICPVPDVDFYRVTAVDENGTVIPENWNIRVSSDGFLGAGSENPESGDNFSVPKFSLYEGKGFVAIKMGCGVTIKRDN